MKFIWRCSSFENIAQIQGFGGFCHGSAIKHPPAVQEILVRFLGQGDPLKEEMEPILVLLPGKKKSHEQRIPTGYSPWDPKKSDMTEQLCKHREFGFSLVQFSHTVMSSALRTHGLQHARLLCPSPTPRTCSNSSIKSVMPFNHLILCHPLSSCLQSFSAAGFFQMSQFCTSIDQSIRASASALIIPINTQD